MSIEHIETIGETSKEKIFEELPFTRDFGDVREESVHDILKENYEYWRLPTVAELYALRKQNGFSFFKRKSYWAKDSIDNMLSDELREFKTGILGSAWYFSNENKNTKKHLVLFKKGTVIEHADEEVEKITEGKYPF